jgi:hypothetical protein
MVPGYLARQQVHCKQQEAGAAGEHCLHSVETAAAVVQQPL